jgi:hypothetical protein
MKLLNYIISFVILVASGILYDKYKIKNKLDEDMENYDLIKKYLLNDSSLANAKKPILWIYLNYEVNSRNWSSFGSRTNNHLNQPYLYLCIASIINHCGDSFNIVIIDDNTFSKIIPDWTYEMNKIPNPIKQNFVKLALTRILYNYGGMLVPPSLVCTKDLSDLYYEGIKGPGMFVGEFLNDNITNQYGLSNFYSNTRLMGCKINNGSMLKLMQEIEIIISKDYTDVNDFEGKVNGICNKLVLTNESNLIDGSLIGVKTKNNKPVLVDDLMGNTYVEFNPNLYGVYLQDNKILKRNKYEWFAKLNVDQVLESNTNIGKLLLVNAFPEK